MGLFTEGPSIDELMAKRNERSGKLQRSLALQAAQGAARPMEAQAASMLGSSLGRALAGAMDGGDYRSKLEANEAAKNATQQQYLTAAAADSSVAMYDMVKVLKKDNPLAAMKMLELAKAKKKEEEAATAAQAAAAAAQVEVLRAEAAEVTENIRAEGVDEDQAAIKVQADIDAASLLAGAKVTGDETQTQAAVDAALLIAEAKLAENVVTQTTGEDLNTEAGKKVYPEGSIWQEEAGGKLTWVNKPTDQKVYTTPVPAGMKLNYDDAGNVAGMEPIVGSKQYVEAQEKKNKTSKGRSDRRVHTNVVMDAVQQVKDISAKDSIWTPIFGPMGAASSKIDATERATLDTIMLVVEANVGFEELNAMRANSPTGGALGNVTEKELILLQNQMGALSRSQSKESFDRNLAQFEITYREVIEGDAQHKQEWRRDNPQAAAANDATMAAAQAPAVAPQTGARSGAGPNAAMPAAVAKYY